MLYKRRSLAGLACAFIAETAHAQSGSGLFIRLWASNKISVEVPRSWSLLDEGQRIDLAAANEATLRRMGQQRATGSLAIAANRYVDNRVQAWMNLRTYPTETASQRDVRDLSPSEIQQFDHELRKGVQAGGQQQGLQILRWNGTQKHLSRARLFILITEYDRSGIENRPPATAILARVLAGSDSFTLTVAFTSSGSALYRPTALEMVESLRIG